MKKILTIIGARPQLIKAAIVSRELLKKPVVEILLHTGQHYDHNMSDIFIDELKLPSPKYNLGVQAKKHGEMTGEMLVRIESILLDEKPDAVMIYGDTNSTLAGALAAAKLHIPIAHVEAGLRSYNRFMPEEINRTLTDHMAEWLFVPTASAMKNLKKEGINRGVYHTGDVMYDAVLHFGSIAGKKSEILDRLGISDKNYYLATLHRSENTDAPDRLKAILSALSELNRLKPVVFPMHPRTKRAIEAMNLRGLVKEMVVTQPLSYLEMMSLEMSADTILTDSGGIQKEAYFHSVPCVTLRDETEWVETVVAGWNQIAGANIDDILKAVQNSTQGHPIYEYGNGDSSRKIAEILTG